MKTVAIIGGAGYIGSHITRKFLSEGYKVRVSASDAGNAAKYEHLKRFDGAERLEIVPLDVRDRAGLDAFLPGCNIVVHSGTPFQLDVADPNRDLFEPTVQGTRNFLEAVKELKGLEKVVMIASVAAFNTNFPLLPEGKSPGDTISEADAPHMSTQHHPYAQAKFLANQIVSEFVAQHPNLGFEITTVSPTGVMGAALSQRADSTSMGVQFLFKNWIAPNPFIQMFYDTDVEWSVVDVEDVSDSVFKAATSKGLHGRNYLLASESYHVSDLHKILNGKESTRAPRVVYDSALAKRELGASMRPAKETLAKYAATQT